MLHGKGRLQTMAEDICIEILQMKDEVDTADLIRRNLANFDESGSVIAAIFRRLSRLLEIYQQPGSQLFVARDGGQHGKIIACAGIGPLHGLDPGEGIGEIRDLVVDMEYREQGLGSKLLHRCIRSASEFHYKRLYLETTQNMVHAQKLFLRTGFRPVTDKHLGSATSQNNTKDIPCYFLMENLLNKVVNT